MIRKITKNSLKVSNLESNSCQQSQIKQKRDEILTKIKTEGEENSIVIEILPKMRECSVILRDIRHDTQDKITEATQELKHEPEKQFLIILSPEKIIQHHKPIKIEEGDVDDSETDKLPTGKLQCKICKKNYSSVDSLRMHKNIHNKRFGCKICGQKYPTKSKLLKHIRNVHKNPGSFKCDVCNVGFNKKAYLDVHQRVHMKNRPKPFKCTKCEYATDCKCSLNEHVKIHEREIGKCKKCNKVLMFKSIIHDCRLDCKYCGKEFSHAGNVANHIKKFHAHEDEKLSYECDICGLKAYRKIYLMRHMKAQHPDGKLQTFTCDFDGKTFKLKEKLYKHMQSHLPKVKCNFCIKKVRIRQLKQHILNCHMKTKQKRKKWIPKRKAYKCPICSKILSTRQSMNRHISGHNKTFKCEFCEKLFGTQSRLKYHIRDYHENPNSFSCEICGLKFAQRLNLKAHLKTHDPNRPRNLKCVQCDFATDKKQSFQGHLNFHKKNNARIAAIKNPHKCPQCPTFIGSLKSLNKHMSNVHPKVLFECDICGKKIKRKAGILKHLMKFHKRC